MKPQKTGIRNDEVNIEYSDNIFTYEPTNQDTLTVGTIIYNFDTKEEDVIVDYKDGRSSITIKGRNLHVSTHALGGGFIRM
jgi:hypothetical protein